MSPYLLRRFLAALLSGVVIAGTAAWADLPATEQAALVAGHGLDLSALDRTVRPGDDFFRYANGKWLDAAEIPPAQGRVGVMEDLERGTLERVRRIVTDAAERPDSSDARKLGDFYRSYMDTRRVEALDSRPMRPLLAEVRRARTKSELAVLMGRSEHDVGVSPFTVVATIDPRNPSRRLFMLAQSGQRLSRDQYLKDQFAQVRRAYRDYIADVLKMIRWSANAQVDADAVLALETRIARASWSPADQRDATKTYNLVGVNQLPALTPGFDWGAYFRGAEVSPTGTILVRENTAFPALAATIAETPMEVLKSWEAFRMTDEAAPWLSDRFARARFGMTKLLTGQAEPTPRVQEALEELSLTFRETIGKAYVARYFPPQAKAKIVGLVNELKGAMRARLQEGAWMSPSTRAEALAKLDRMRIEVGYPDRWRQDLGELKVDPTDLFGNVRRAARYRSAYRMRQVGQPVDSSEWTEAVQTVDAFSNPRRNRIVFPAGILQPPLFNPQADDAVNYGAIGAVIGHEISHGFDDQGRRFDATGALRDWWAPEDAKRYEAEAAKLVKQFEAYEPLPGAHLNGRLTLGENLGDLGGLVLALEAYHRSLMGRPAPVLDGLTGDQRLFLAWAQSWRHKEREERTRSMLTFATHSPPSLRVNGSTRNVDAWYAAFGVQPADKNYLAPADRVHLW